MSDLPALADRQSLPPTLRQLLDELPRAGWEAHPNFGGLVQFWLDRHLDFRDMHGRMTADVRAVLDGGLDAEAWKPRLARLGGRFLDHIHGHHMIEDHEYFPLLARLEPRLSAGFDMLERDHQELDPVLSAFAERANAVLRGEADAAGALEAELQRLGGFLHRHLSDEEDLVVPVVLKTGLG